MISKDRYGFWFLQISGTKSLNYRTRVHTLILRNPSSSNQFVSFVTLRFYQIRRNKSENYSFVLLKSAKLTWFDHFKIYSLLYLKIFLGTGHLKHYPSLFSKFNIGWFLVRLIFDIQHVIVPLISITWSTGIPQWAHVIWKFCDFLVSFCLGMMHRLWFIRLLVSIVQSDCGFRLIKDEYSDFVVEF